MKKTYTFTLLIFGLLLSSCSNSPDVPPVEPASSIYVANAGNFSQSNGSITGYNLKTGKANQQAFQAANNGRSFGGLIQSAEIIGDRFYIVSNKADKIEVADLKSLTSVATIPMNESPTAFVKINDREGWATTLNNSIPVDSVSIIDLENNKETDQRIAVGNQPRDIVQVGNKVYVANAGGITPQSVGNTISVINTKTDKLVKTLTVGDKPYYLYVDQSDQIWVMCKGLDVYGTDEGDTPGSLYIINGADASVINHIDVGGHPNGFVLDEKDSRGYLIDNGIKVINLNTKEVTKQLFENNSSAIYRGIFYSQQHRKLFVGKFPAFGQPGHVLIYDNQGTAVDSFRVGIAPTRIYGASNR